MIAWGDNDYGQTSVPVAAQSGVVAIAAGYLHSMALRGPTFVQAAPPSGRVGTTYSYAFKALMGSTAATSYQLVTGTLPPGLTLNASGVLSGTPTTAGDYGFDVRATVSPGVSVLKNVFVHIDPALIATRLTVTPSQYSSFHPLAQLTLASSPATGIPGQTVKFFSRGIQICSAVTNSDGFARCTTTLRLGVSATYAGTSVYGASTGSAGVLN